MNSDCSHSERTLPERENILINVGTPICIVLSGIVFVIAHSFSFANAAGPGGAAELAYGTITLLLLVGLRYGHLCFKKNRILGIIYITITVPLFLYALLSIVLSNG